MRRSRVWEVLLLGGSALVGGCQCTPTEHKLTEWFKYEEVGPLIELPHTLRIGQRSQRTFIRLGDAWRELPGEDGQFLLTAEQGQAVYGEGPFSGRIYVRGRTAPLSTGNVPCVKLEGGWKQGSVACLGLKSQGRCGQVIFGEFSLDGTQRVFAAEVPVAPFGCPWPDLMQWAERVSLLGYDAQGNPFIAAPSMNPDMPSLRNQWVLRLDEHRAMPVEETDEKEISALKEQLRQRYLLTPPSWPEPEQEGPRPP